MINQKSGCTVFNLLPLNAASSAFGLGGLERMRSRHFNRRPSEDNILDNGTSPGRQAEHYSHLVPHEFHSRSPFDTLRDEHQESHQISLP